MIIIILNKSKKKSFRTSRRIINKVLPRVDLRLNVGNIPLRVLVKLVDDLKKTTTKGTSIKIFVENKNGYHKMNIIQIGTKHSYLEIFEMTKSNYE